MNSVKVIESKEKELFELSEKAKKNSALPYAVERILCKTDPAPVSMTIRPTSVCNRKCNFCLCESRNLKYQSIFVKDSIINQFYEDIYNLGVRGVTIAGGGEPTTLSRNYYKGLFENNSIRLFWHTNGILIDKYIEELSKNTDFISFSVLSHRPDFYHLITGETSDIQFHKILENIKLFSESPILKQVAIQVKLLVTREIVPYLQEYYSFFHNLGLKLIKFSVVKNFEIEQQVELAKDEQKIVSDWMTSIPGIDLSLSQKIVYGRSIYGYVPEKCWVSELGLYATLEPDGRIFPCSQWSSDNTVCLGNINDAPFIEIWNSERRKQVKRLLNLRIQKNICNYSLCRHYQTNIAIDLYHKGILSYGDISANNNPSPFI